SEERPEPDPRQESLFADHVVLARGVDEAVRAGRFEEAAGLRQQLEATFGASRFTDSLDFLERLGACQWDGPPAEAFSVWEEIEARIGDGALRVQVRGGVYIRLLERHTADELASASPERLPELVLVLASLSGRPSEEGRTVGRRLVRDRLAAGRCLDSLAFR